MTAVSARPRCKRCGWFLPSEREAVKHRCDEARVVVRVYVDGKLDSEERRVLAGEEAVAKLFGEYVDRLADQLHMFEFEFVDAPWPNERFLRLGTDPRRMKRPRQLERSRGAVQ